MGTEPIAGDTAPPAPPWTPAPDEPMAILMHPKGTGAAVIERATPRHDGPGPRDGGYRTTPRPARPEAQPVTDQQPIGPRKQIPAKPWAGRARLGVRWARSTMKFLGQRYLDFAANCLRAEVTLAGLSIADLVPGRGRECNLCGWKGRRFYPNVGPGYDERDTICPGCGCLDRHRALTLILARRTDFWSPGRRIIEVAPPRGFQALCLAQGDLNYTSFDIERYAMEHGDITAMRYPDASCDYFLCFHVLEHVPAEARALSEIRRVLRPGGTLVAQVPVDWKVAKTYEYDQPDPREVGHVRRYGQDFGDRLGAAGFEVQAIRAADCATEEEVQRLRLGREPIFFARRPA